MVKRSLSLNSLLAGLIALAFVGLAYYSPAFLERVERSYYDAVTRLALPDTPMDQRILLVEIDQKSLDKLGSWPWPRDLIARMVHLARGSGAKVIGLNLPLLDEERNAALRELKGMKEKFSVYSLGQKDDSLADWVQENLAECEAKASEDLLLIEAVKEAGNVILPAMILLPAGQVKGKWNPGSILPRDFLGMKEPLPPPAKTGARQELYLPFQGLAEAAMGFGHDDVLKGQAIEGIASPLYIQWRGSLLPSYALRLALACWDQTPSKAVVEENHLRLRGEAIPLWEGKMLVKFLRGFSNLERVSFSDVLDGQKKPSMKGKAVLIGTNFGDQRKILSTPLSAATSEDQFNCLVLDNLLNKRSLTRPGYMVYAEMGALGLLGLVGALVFPRIGQIPRLLFTVVGVAALMGAGFLLLARWEMWFRMSYVLMGFLTLYAFVSVSQFFFKTRLSRETIETHRLLGLNFQSQGLLDLALEKFRRLPLDAETRDLIYNLGLEYEQKRLIAKALSVYEYANRGGGFRDLDTRILKLKEVDKSSTIGSHLRAREPSVLDETVPEELTRIGRYEILQVLGRGSMGLVYKALDPKINRLLAIKTIRFSDEFDEDVIQEIKERFFREAEIAGQLSHPSIVTIHDMGEDQDLTFMAMEYLEGENLEKFIGKKNLLPLRKVLSVVASVADALEFAHRADVIHRDIKPANIMLLKTGGVKVTDFGIAKAISSSRTRTGVILGTPNYMSPEQIMGQKIDPRSDIFSLGVVFYQLLAGELPFQGDNLSSLLYQITQVKHPPLRSFNPRIPVACEQILDKALAKNLEERFQNAGQLAKLVRLLALKVDQKQKKRLAGQEAAVKA
ncbi:MAG: serine/threonine-protein kinase [Desulfobacterota bacterium]|jgi:serine/threonine-protein kinase|nr:serine/threonine-protein kinase [Thermodesulfobacteriota bacterium]